jgi:hypothetical protein
VTRPTVEVADIFGAQGKNFIDRHRNTIRFQQLKVMHAIMRCRTSALGGHVDICPRCGGDQTISYNSCRNRHCPKCQSQARQRWIAARKQELLATRYFHVVFTLPHELHSIVLQNEAELYNLLFRTVAETLLEIAHDPKHLGAKIGFFGILHTWGQNLLFHPNIHCVIPGGGITPDYSQWIHPRYPFFLPVKVLGKVFRGKFVEGLRRAFRHERLKLAGQIQHFTESKASAASSRLPSSLVIENPGRSRSGFYLNMARLGFPMNANDNTSKWRCVNTTAFMAVYSSVDMNVRVIRPSAYGPTVRVFYIYTRILIRGRTRKFRSKTSSNQVFGWVKIVGMNARHAASSL